MSTNVPYPTNSIWETYAALERRKQLNKPLNPRTVGSLRNLVADNVRYNQQAIDTEDNEQQRCCCRPSSPIRLNDEWEAP